MRPPGVAFAWPDDGARVPRGFTVVVEATAERAVADVELWIDGLRVGVDATPPYDFDVPVGVDAGEHVLEARVVDDAGQASVAAVMVTVETDGAAAPEDGGCAVGEGGLGLCALVACLAVSRCCRSRTRRRSPRHRSA